MMDNPYDHGYRRGNSVVVKLDDKWHDGTVVEATAIRVLVNADDLDVPVPINPASANLMHHAEYHGREVTRRSMSEVAGGSSVAHESLEQLDFPAEANEMWDEIDGGLTEEKLLNFLDFLK